MTAQSHQHNREKTTEHHAENKQDIIAVTQARMGSTRLPGKSLLPIMGKSIIWHVINRVKQSNYVTAVILATSTSERDVPLLAEAKRAGALAFAGSEDDVLDRFYQAVKQRSSAILVRITGDCPLIDPVIIDKNISIFLKGGYDYVHSGVTYPDGIGDCEVFSFAALEEAWKRTTGTDREHVTPYIWKHPEQFRISTIEHDEDLSAYIFSVDHNEQYEAVCRIYEGVYTPGERFHLKDIMMYVRAHLKIHELTQHIERSCPENLIKKQLAEKYAQSKKLLDRAKRVTPSGGHTYSKCYRYYGAGAAPAFLDRGRGSHVWDVDGNEFIDFGGSFGAITVGYTHPVIDDAVRAQLDKGIGFSQPTALGVELAEKLISIIPSAQMVRFFNNGSDATSAAVRLARAFTGRELIAVSGYHGYQDWYVRMTENDWGTPKVMKQLVLGFEYNTFASLKKNFDEHPGKIAAVILEPVQDDGPTDEFLQRMQQLAHEHGALLILDEVVSGFRVHLKGAQGLFNVSPDLTVFGEGMANGLPLSAVFGRADVLKHIEEGAFISTTHGGEAISLAGSLATIRVLERPGTYERLWALGKKLRTGLQQLIKEYGLQQSVSTRGLDIHFAPVFKQTGKFSSFDLLSVFQQTMIAEGILVLTSVTLCTEHSDEDVAAYLRAARVALAAVQRAI